MSVAAGTKATPEAPAAFSLASVGVAAHYQAADADQDRSQANTG